jgi:hypothetical protein
VNIREIDIAKLNTLTKYPSIPTYHKLGDKGILLDETNVKFDSDELVYLTEKIDGTNARIVLLPNGDYLIGSRDNFLTYSGDVIANPSLSIVDTLSDIVKKLNGVQHEGIIVLYLEVYGGKIGGQSKQYTTEFNTGARLFDSQVIDVYDELLKLEISQIASWRDNNHQAWISPQYLYKYEEKGIVATVPALKETTGKCLPVTILETQQYLSSVISKSQALLDDSGKGSPEGLVVRNATRTKIAKIRYEDYTRTLRAKK